MGQRALVFRAGTVGLFCAAYEVEFIGGGQDRAGTMRTVGSCNNPVTKVLETADGCKTGFCATCYDLIADSPSVGKMTVQHPRDN